MRLKTSTKGFTLIEVLVASTIIIVLTTIGAVAYNQAGKSARDSKRKADLEVIRQALVMRRSELGSYPTASSTANEAWLSSNLSDYLSEPYPVDPKTPVHEYNYSYNSGDKSFTLSAYSEVSGSNDIELTSP